MQNHAFDGASSPAVQRAFCHEPSRSTSLAHVDTGSLRLARGTRAEGEAQRARIDMRAGESSVLARHRRPAGPLVRSEPTSAWFCIQGLFFGDFLLALQKKVTRPPGRIPGAVYRSPLTRIGTRHEHSGTSHEEPSAQGTNKEDLSMPQQHAPAPASATTPPSTTSALPQRYRHRAAPDASHPRGRSRTPCGLPMRTAPAARRRQR